MFKKIKQDKKIKTFKNPAKRVDNPSINSINGKIEDPHTMSSQYLAVIATKKKPKKRMPKNEEMFFKPKKGKKK